jgi:hypothetical protein
MKRRSGFLGDFEGFLMFPFYVFTLLLWVALWSCLGGGFDSLPMVAVGGRERRLELGLEGLSGLSELGVEGFK